MDTVHLRKLFANLVIQITEKEGEPPEQDPGAAPGEVAEGRGALGQEKLKNFDAAKEREEGIRTQQPDEAGECPRKLELAAAFQRDVGAEHKKGNPRAKVPVAIRPTCQPIRQPLQLAHVG